VQMATELGSVAQAGQGMHKFVASLPAGAVLEFTMS
jgi:hypothetical protein